MVKPLSALAARRIAQLGLWGEQPLFVMDVGCGGGLHERWSFAGDRLRAVGFDPSADEIDRLRRTNAHPGVVYEAALVTDADGGREPVSASVHANDPFERSSAAAAQRRQRAASGSPSDADLAPGMRAVTVDGYLSDPGDRTQLDFIKIDTDGHDIEVLRGAEATVAAGGVLALSVEVQLHGGLSERANTFANVDLWLRRRGFTIVDLVLHRYSREALPAAFLYDFPGQTVSGQVLWGDALYVRDLTRTDYEDAWSYRITPERVMKLVSLLDLFEFRDCAAELLLARGGFLEPACRDELLDLLAGEGAGSYGRHVAAFREDFTQFCPTTLETRRVLPGWARPRAVNESMTDALLKMTAAEFRHQIQELQARLQKRGERITELTTQIDELKSRASRKGPS